MFFVPPAKVVEKKINERLLFSFVVHFEACQRASASAEANARRKALPDNSKT